MICPKCADTLEEKKLQNISLHECPKCKGIWFEKNQFHGAVEEIDPDLRWVDFDFWKHKERFAAISAGINCPKGHPKNMVALYYKSPDVKIYICPIDEGIWIAANDFLKIIQALEKETDTRSVSDYVRISLKEAMDIISHPTRLLSEWRDFTTVFRLLEYRFFTENKTLKDVLVGIQKSLPL